MHHRPTVHSCDPRTDFSTEKFDVLVELADSIRELTYKFDRVQQILDAYETKVLRTESEMLELHQYPDLNILCQWQDFIERVTKEFDILTPPT